jgi:hypothetical protein
MFSVLVSIYAYRESFFDFTDGIKMIRHLGVVLKTDILDYPVPRLHDRS